MTGNINGLSRKQAQFFSHLAAEGKNFFSTQQAQAYSGAPAYTGNVLSHWYGKVGCNGWSGGYICCILWWRARNGSGLRVRMEGKLNNFPVIGERA